MTRTRWYKDAVIYQIYPRSFKDSNGDGIGDIRGIIEKLDYIKDLGVNAVWLSPCYKSPNADNGYDISDYRDIMQEFGTLDDWQEMTDGLHFRGIRLIMDLVVNHTSDEHPWFTESRKSKDNPYRDYYIWRKGRGKNGQRPPNNWTSRFGGPAWTRDDVTGEWYLRLFTPKQPDLNWDNPKVREEVADICKYWLDKGVDGFRCDVITYISKREGLPRGKFNPVMCGDEHFTHGPKIHEYLHELYVNVLSKYDCMTVGEAAGATVDTALQYTAEDRQELDTVFHFEHAEADMAMHIFPKKLKLTHLKEIFERWQFGLAGKAWNSLYYENHDQPRALGRYTGDFGINRLAAAKMLAVSYYFQQGTPYIYQGQEIGMLNYPFVSLDEYKDQFVEQVRKMLGGFEPILRPIAKKILLHRARDHARTSMQWDTSANAGFTDGTPWFVTHPNYTKINVAEAEADENSILNFYKKLNRYRIGNELIKKGSYLPMFKNHKDIYAYERWYNGERLVVICNFKNKIVKSKMPGDLVYNKCSLEIHNYGYDRPQLLDQLNLRPYEALVYKLL